MDRNNVTLAEHPGLGQVRLCACNSIHLTIGPVTMTLAVEAFGQTTRLICHAMESLSVIVAAGELNQDPLQTLTLQQRQITQ